MNNNLKTHRYTSLSNESSSELARDIYLELKSQLIWRIDKKDYPYVKDDLENILGKARTLAEWDLIEGSGSVR